MDIHFCVETRSVHKIDIQFGAVRSKCLVFTLQILPCSDLSRSVAILYFDLLDHSGPVSGKGLFSSNYIMIFSHDNRYQAKLGKSSDSGNLTFSMLLVLVFYFEMPVASPCLY